MVETLLLLLAGFLAGTVCATVACWAFWGVPLARAARACGRRAATDLSRTLPEEGPRPLRLLTRTLNDLEADFQEVLLLFSHMSRSARASADLLRPIASEASGSPSAERIHEVLAEMEAMEATIRDFRYFRVSIDDGVIRDAGASGGRSLETY